MEEQWGGIRSQCFIPLKKNEADSWWFKRQPKKAKMEQKKKTAIKFAVMQTTNIDNAKITRHKKMNLDNFISTNNCKTRHF